MLHFRLFGPECGIIKNLLQLQYMDISIRHLRLFTIYFISNHIFFKKYFKAISGQIFM